MYELTGRYETRTRRVVHVELLRPDEFPHIKTGVTENVSSRGARIVTEYDCPPGKDLVITAPEEGVKSLGRVVYCEPLERSKFAVGLRLVVRVKEWGKPASRD